MNLYRVRIQLPSGVHELDVQHRTIAGAVDAALEAVAPAGTFFILSAKLRARHVPGGRGVVSGNEPPRSV